MNKGTKYGLAILAAVLLVGLAGRADYAEQVIYTMPHEVYSQIRDTLGADASDYEIARYYVKHYNKEEKK